MTVDLIVQVPDGTTPDQLEQWSFDLGYAVGPHHFLVEDGKGKVEIKGWRCHRALLLTTPDPSLPPGTYAEVTLAGWYYDGVRRDPWAYAEIAQWCATNIPGAVVYAKVDDDPWTTFKGVIDQLQADWEANPVPFTLEKPVDPPICPQDAIPAQQYGTGKGYASFGCLKCDRQWVWVEGKVADPVLIAATDDAFTKAQELKG